MYVNVEHQVFALSLGAIQRPAVGAVIVAKNLGVFEKLIALDALLEFLAADVNVVFSRLFVAASLASGVRNREPQTRIEVQEAGYQCGICLSLKARR